ncbi:MAG: hypothetical protein FJ276_20795 [Planctomycetes bacterium]|nr:hypothetical protein [Planctomycetota bacterium]
MLARAVAGHEPPDATEVAAAYCFWLESDPFDVRTNTHTGLAAGSVAVRKGEDAVGSCRWAASRASQATPR